MSLFYKDVNDGIRIYVWKQEETADELCRLAGDRGLRLKKEAEKRFKSEKRQLEWLAVRALLRVAAGKDAAIRYRINGEPYLEGSDCRISISHTDRFVCLAVHPFRHVGVDIEVFSHRIDRVVSHVVHPSEASCVPLSGDDATRYPLIVWSMKESVFKCLDMVTLDYMHGIRIAPFRLGVEGRTRAAYLHKGFCYPLTVHYISCPHYVLTWCREQGMTEVRTS